MAKIQISWQDNADNETSFKVYQGTSSPVQDTDTLIATVALSSGTWDVSGSAANVLLTSSNTGDSVTTGETFTLTYDESVDGTYYYGVAASNAVGDSAIATGSVAVIVNNS